MKYRHNKIYGWRLFISFDQLFNVALSPALNWLVSEGGAKFGSPDETMSSVFGKNQRTGTCKTCTWVCRNILHPIDRKHCEKSIETDENG